MAKNDSAKADETVLKTNLCFGFAVDNREVCTTLQWLSTTRLSGTAGLPPRRLTRRLEQVGTGNSC